MKCELRTLSCRALLAIGNSLVFSVSEINSH